MVPPGKKRCRSEPNSMAVSGEGIFMSYRSAFKVHALHLKLYDVSAMCCGKPRWSHVSKTDVSNIEGERCGVADDEVSGTWAKTFIDSRAKRKYIRLVPRDRSEKVNMDIECFQGSHPRTSRTASIRRITNNNISYSKEAVSNSATDILHLSFLVENIEK